MMRHLPHPISDAPAETPTTLLDLLDLDTSADEPRPRGGLRQFLARQGPRSRRVAKYMGTSVLSTVVSELTLIGLLGLGLATAVPAAVVATLTGGLLSYLFSRYWIWPEADRQRAGRQLVRYAAITVAGLLLSSFATGEVAAHVVGAHELRVAEIALAYFATYVVLWIAKYALYQLMVFRGPQQAR